MRVAALIMARNGSVGLPGKNMADVCGKPLMRYPIEAAHRAKCVDEVFISSDIPGAEKMARATGSVYMPRLEKLSGATAQMSEVIDEFVLALKRFHVKPDVLITMHGNCAIHPAGLIDDCVAHLLAGDLDSCVSVRVIEDMHPYRQKRIGTDGMLTPWVDIPADVQNNRQATAERSVILDGACRALRVDRCLPPEGQPPFRYLGNRIGFVENPGGLDVHNTNDLALTREWVREHLAPETPMEMALRGYG